MAKRADRAKVKAWDQMLGQMNAAPITADQLRDYIAECQAQRDSGLDPFAIQVFTAARFAPKDFIRASALSFRAQALSRIVGDTGKGAHGWTIPGPDGSVYAAHAVFAAAVAEPMINDTDDWFTFARQPFLDRVLALSSTEGPTQ